jgi:hypothetical protein
MWQIIKDEVAPALELWTDIIFDGEQTLMDFFAPYENLQINEEKRKRNKKTKKKKKERTILHFPLPSFLTIVLGRAQTLKAFIHRDVHRCVRQPTTQTISLPSRCWTATRCCRTPSRKQITALAGSQASSGRDRFGLITLLSALGKSHNISSV